MWYWLKREISAKRQWLTAIVLLCVPVSLSLGISLDKAYPAGHPDLPSAMAYAGEAWVGSVLLATVLALYPIAHWSIAKLLKRYVSDIDTANASVRLFINGLLAALGIEIILGFSLGKEFMEGYLAAGKWLAEVAKSVFDLALKIFK